MFEKEAKEYAIDAPPPFSVAREAFQKGAEFGYNKGKNEAKELVQKFYSWACGRSGDDLELLEQAAKFLFLEEKK